MANPEGVQTSEVEISFPTNIASFTCIPYETNTETVHLNITEFTRDVLVTVPEIARKFILTIPKGVDPTPFVEKATHLARTESKANFTINEAGETNA